MRAHEGPSDSLDQAGAIVRISAPAKINLTLEVLSKREDGYHALRSVMVPLEFCDDLEIEPSSELTFTCSDATLAGEDNLVVRALRALRASARVHLEKRIFTQAGLGGGSSDAAAILRAAMRGAFGSIHVDWLSVARALGSDVPFFLVETAALVEGTGERVTALGRLPAWHVIVIKPPVAVSTADAYRMVDETSRPTRPRSSSTSLDMAEALQRADFSRVEQLLSNDFHDVIASRYEPVRAAVETLRHAGARSALLSGSGSALFALFPDEAAAKAVHANLHLPNDFAVIRTRFADATLWQPSLA